MNTVEDRLREALAARAEQSSVDPQAWDKVVARSRHHLRPWQWPTWAVRLAPVAGVVAVAAVVALATLVGTHIGRGTKPAGPATANPSISPILSPVPVATASLPAGMTAVVRQIPPVTPFVSISLLADGHQVKNSLWFGYVPGHADAGIALCQFNSSGDYTGYSDCTSGGLTNGAQAQSAGTDGTGWIRLGVTAPQVTSVTAVLSGGKTVNGTVRTVRGLGEKVWAVSYSPESVATLVFRDAAGHQVTQLSVARNETSISQPSQGGIPLFRYGKGTVTAYRISGDRIGYFFDGGSTWSDVPLSQSKLGWSGTGGPAPLPNDLFGYAPSGTARVVLQLAGGRQVVASRTISGWPGSGIVFWGPVTLPAHTTMNYDSVVITYDAAGHVLREVPIIFVQ